MPSEVCTVGIVAGLLPSEEVYPHQILRILIWVLKAISNFAFRFALIVEYNFMMIFAKNPHNRFILYKCLQVWGPCATTGFMLGNPVNHVQPRQDTICDHAQCDIVYLASVCNTMILYHLVRSRGMTRGMPIFINSIDADLDIAKGFRVQLGMAWSK